MSKNFSDLVANSLEQKIVEDENSFLEQGQYANSIEEFTIEDSLSVISILSLKELRPLITPEMLLEGMNVELEHGTKNALTNITNDDPVITAKIAIVHIDEDLEYYPKLKKMESE